MFRKKESYIAFMGPVKAGQKCKYTVNILQLNEIK